MLRCLHYLLVGGHIAGAKDDSSTGIDVFVKAFAKDMSERATKILKEAAGKKTKQKDKPATVGDKKGPPKVVFSLDNNPSDKVRTPAEQAAEVAKGASQVCWGAHLSDKSRHVIMKIDGKPVRKEKEVKDAFGDDYPAFKKEWASCMKAHGGLLNAAGDVEWYTGSLGDFLHLEHTDERAVSCIEEYVKLATQLKIAITNSRINIKRSCSPTSIPTMRKTVAKKEEIFPLQQASNHGPRNPASLKSETVRCICMLPLWSASFVTPDSGGTSRVKLSQ